MKFLIMGTGGVGGFFGGTLAAAGEDVTFVARGAHFRAIRDHGLRLRTTSKEWTVGPGHVKEHPGEAGIADAILFCVKAYDTETAARLLRPAVGPRTVIVSLQNGIDNEEVIRKVIREGIVMGGVAYVSARISAPGEITESGGFSRIVFGPLDDSRPPEAASLLSAFVKAGIRAELRDDIISELWRKFIFISSMGSMTALTRLSQGEILASPETMDLVFSAMQEAAAVGKAAGISFEPLARENVVEGLKRFDPGTRSSLYYDLVNGKPIEIESLNGTLVRLGRQFGIPTPIHNTIFASLIPYHRRSVKVRE